jgi:hypothetical protein
VISPSVPTYEWTGIGPAGEQGWVLWTTTLSLAELVSTLSVASDLGIGRPVERLLRQTVIAMRLADAAGVDPGVRAATYYSSLLTWVGCATDTSELTEQP